MATTLILKAEVGALRELYICMIFSRIQESIVSQFMDRNFPLVFFPKSQSEELHYSAHCPRKDFSSVFLPDAKIYVPFPLLPTGFTSVVGTCGVLFSTVLQRH